MTVENIEPSIKLVRTLKGAPLSVLLVMRLIGQPVTAEYLERTTGYTDKPVNSALLLLEEYGMITRNGRYAWQICAGAMQLPLVNLLLSENDFEQDISEPANPDSQGQVIDLPSDANRRTRNFSDSELFRVPSSSRSLKPDLKDLVVKQPLLEPDSDSEKIRVAENLAACTAVGIEEPKKTSISQMPHVTPALIQFHAETAQNLALAIYRISANWRINPGWSASHRVGIVCAQTIQSQPDRHIALDCLDRWAEVKKQLEKHFKPADYKTWIDPLKLIEADRDCYTFYAYNAFAGGWAVDHALRQIEDLLGTPVKIVWDGKE